MEEVQKMIPVLRYYNVFHIEDCEGIKSKLDGKPVCTLKPVEQAEKVIADYYGREKCTLEVKKSEPQRTNRIMEPSRWVILLITFHRTDSTLLEPTS